MSTRPLVLVTLGTDHHVFDRLVDWVDEYAEVRGDKVDLVVQYGYSRRRAEHVEALELIGFEELHRLMRRADVLITPGPNTIMEAREYGLRGIFIPRDPELAEIVDDHQLVFARRSATEDLFEVAEDTVSLFTLVDDAIADPDCYHFDPAALPPAPGIARIAAAVDALVCGQHNAIVTAATLTGAPWDHLARGRLLRPEWPLTLICVGMPLAFLFGVHGLVWVLPVFAFGTQLLLQREPVAIPRSAVPLVLLVCWIPITLLQLDPGRQPLAIFRWLVFASPLLCLLWLLNRTEAEVPTRRIVQLLATLWIVVVAFGYLAVLAPNFSAPSPLQQLLPLSTDYFADISRWRFAELSQGVAVGRPAAPMAYANGWGSTLGLLTPFFVLHFFVLGDARRRRVGLLVTCAAIVPIVHSLNRGLWLSIAVAFAYVAIRRAVQGNVRVGIAVALAALGVFVALGATTLGDTVNKKFEVASESNETRGELYEVGVDVALEQPITGWGATVDRGLEREIGTHGLFWFTMVAFGFPGLLLLLAWVAATFVTTARAPNAIALWAHAAILVFGLQIMIYGLLPQLMLAGVAAAVAMRAQRMESISP